MDARITSSERGVPPDTSFAKALAESFLRSRLFLAAMLLRDVCLPLAIVGVVAVCSFLAVFFMSKLFFLAG